jgi:membrane protease YdiL (CAAX protease family)
MTTGLAERFTASAEEWTCSCGRVNVAGLSLCPRCGRVPPRGVALIDVGPVGPSRAASSPKVRGVRLALGVILLNIVLQAFMLGLVEAGHMERSKAITLLMWMGLVFYGVVLAMIAGPLVTLRPNWVRGDSATARLLGAEVGVAAAGVLIALTWAAKGHPVLDPAAQATVSEGSVARIVLAFVVIAVVAPVVEELLFRGVVLESLRGRGVFVAVFVSSFLFALAHLGGLVYYTGCGVVLGVLYWRRGLWASVSAHAAFNGSLVLLSVLVALGPSHLLSADGVSLRAPSDWQVADNAPPAARLALSGPSGSSLVVLREPVDATLIDVRSLAAALNSGRVPLPPGWTMQPSSAHVTTYPTGPAVEASMTVNGRAAVIVLFPRRSAVWEVNIATAGSDRAVREYPGLLQTLVLPPD